jgi:dCMP deaminase
MRPDWTTYFLQIAETVATRSTCDRKHVGAVLVRDKAILATGYNGSIAGMPHCDEIGHLMEDNHCVRTVHAESNAVAQAARNGVRLEGSTLYCTASPCWLCFKLLVNAGIKSMVYREFYQDNRIFGAAQQLGIELITTEEK